jgi:hypothetical protein
LAGVVKAPQVADFGDKGHCHHKRDAAHRLIGLDHRRHRPARHNRGHLLIEAAPPGRSIIDRVHRILENDLLSRVIELLPRQPVKMRPAPMLAATEDPPVAQQKRQQLLALAAQILRCSLARPDEVAYRFMHRVRHPNRRQLTGAKQPCQRHCITPVGLDPFAGLLRDQGWRDDGAVVTQSANLAIQPVPVGPAS